LAGQKKRTFSAQIDTYGRTSSAIFPVSITLRSIKISATKLLPALQQQEKRLVRVFLKKRQRKHKKNRVKNRKQSKITNENKKKVGE